MQTNTNLKMTFFDFLGGICDAFSGFIDDKNL